jgi:hypothetical protein
MGHAEWGEGGGGRGDARRTWEASDSWWRGAGCGSSARAPPCPRSAVQLLRLEGRRGARGVGGSDHRWVDVDGGGGGGWGDSEHTDARTHANAHAHAHAHKRTMRGRIRLRGWEVGDSLPAPPTFSPISLHLGRARPDPARIVPSDTAQPARLGSTRTGSAQLGPAQLGPSGPGRTGPGRSSRAEPDRSGSNRAGPPTPSLRSGYGGQPPQGR